MREILFKAKRADNGEFVEGYYVNVVKPYCILSSFNKAFGTYIIASNNEMVEVIPETISQYTGLQDKNGTNVFEGDIVNYFGKSYLNSEVIFKDGCFMFKFLSKSTQELRRSKEEPIFKNISMFGEVISNIYNNADLLN